MLVAQETDTVLPAQGVEVTIASSSLTEDIITVTGEDGRFTVGVPDGFYEVTASYDVPAPAPQYTGGAGQFLVSNFVCSEDIELVFSPSDERCEADCSFRDDNVVHRECHLRSGCVFPVSRETQNGGSISRIDAERRAVQNACDGVTVGFSQDYNYEYNEEQYQGRVLCASSILEDDALPDEFTVEARNIVRRETPVLLPDGRIGKVVIYVWK